MTPPRRPPQRNSSKSPASSSAKGRSHGPSGTGTKSGTKSASSKSSPKGKTKKGQPAPYKRWIPAAAAVAVLAVVVFAGAFGGDDSRGDATGPDVTSEVPGLIDSTSTTDPFGVTG